MEIPTYLNFIGRFSGAISLSKQWNESKQAKTQNKHTSKFSVNPTWRACRILDAQHVYKLFAQTLSMSTNTTAWDGLRFGISLRPLFVIFKSYQVTKHLHLFEHRLQMFHLGREQASMKPMNGGVDWVKLLLVLQHAFNAFLDWNGVSSYLLSPPVYCAGFLQSVT
jgi:hypothetical protein